MIYNKYFLDKVVSCRTITIAEPSSGARHSPCSLGECILGIPHWNTLELISWTHFSQRNIICGKKIQDSEFLNLHGSFYTDLRIQLPLDGVASIDFLDSFQVDFGSKAHW